MKCRSTTHKRLLSRLSKTIMTSLERKNKSLSRRADCDAAHPHLQAVRRTLLQPGKLNIRRHQFNAFCMMQNTFSGAYRLIHQNSAHCIRQCKGQLVRLRISQADCQSSLWVPVDQKHFLSGLCQTYSQVRTGCCFANAAFLASDGDVKSNYISPFRYKKTPESLDFPGFLNYFDIV